MSALSWFGLGFLAGSTLLAIAVFMLASRLRGSVEDMEVRLYVAEKRCEEAERWAQMLGASLYGEADNTD